MKARTFLLVCITVLLCAAPALAQQPEDVCDLDLAQVYLYLASAQVASNLGNTPGVVSLLEMSQQEIDAWKTACQMGLSAPPDRVPTRNRVIVQVDLGQYEPSVPVTKLEALAFEYGIALTIIGTPSQFIEELRSADVAGAIYGGEASNELLAGIKAFVQSGGKALLFYGGVPSTWRWSDINTSAQEYLGVSLVQEQMSWYPELNYADDLLPLPLAGLDIRLLTGGEAKYYLVVPGGDGRRGFVSNSRSGFDRLMFYQSPDDRLILWPNVYRGVLSQYFFSDEHIDSAGNRAGAVALLRYLSS